MDIRNYAQRVGKSSCVRCDFDTDESMSFADQDEAMRAHLEEKHPGWQTDGGASILKRRMPVSDADQIAALEQENTRLREALDTMVGGWSAFKLDADSTCISDNKTMSRAALAGENLEAHSSPRTGRTGRAQAGHEAATRTGV